MIKKSVITDILVVKRIFLLNSFIFIISISLYFFAPVKYNLLFCDGITILFLFHVIPFLIEKSNGNYVNFYTLFFVSFFFTNFFYPALLYPIDPQFFSIFSLPFNADYINKGIALAQLTASSIILGANVVKSKKQHNINISLSKYFISHNGATITTILLFFFFIATVGKDFLTGDFTGQSTLSIYILQLVTCSFILSPILFYRNFDQQKGKVLFYLTAFVYVLLFLAIGDRGPALFLFILMMGLYSMNVKIIPLKYLILIGATGFILMHLIGIGRSKQSNVEGNIIQRGIEQTQSYSGFQPYFAITQSFVVNTRNLYVGMEYADKKGLNYGSTSVIVSVLSTIPFAQSAFEVITGHQLQTSSQFLTMLEFGKEPPYGLGTNLVADIYISFGLTGCVILFYFLGWFVEHYRNKLNLNNNMYSSIIYFTLLSFSVYYPRSGLFVPVKLILWTFFIYYMLKQFKILKIRSLN